MSEWWTYRLEDFLMFAPATYQRLFALYNAAVWPAQVPAALLALGSGWALACGRVRLACAAAALAWLVTGIGFHWLHYASIHTGAPWFAGGFVVQAMVMAWMARPGSPWTLRAHPRWARKASMALLALAVLGWPLLTPMLGRPLSQVALWGLTPDPTALGTLALLLALQRNGSKAPLAVGPWVIPVLWCLASVATLWTLSMPDGAWLAGITLTAVIAAVGAALSTRDRSSRETSL
jgi:hypothetical protein